MVPHPEERDLSLGLFHQNELGGHHYKARRFEQLAVCLRARFELATSWVRSMKEWGLEGTRGVVDPMVGPFRGEGGWLISRLSQALLTTTLPHVFLDDFSRPEGEASR